MGRKCILHRMKIIRLERLSTFKDIIDGLYIRDPERIKKYIPGWEDNSSCGELRLVNHVKGKTIYSESIRK
jgi:hypothetical protein